LLTCARPPGVWGLSLDTGELRQFACGSPRCEACAPEWARRLQRRVTPFLTRAGAVFRGAVLPDGARDRMMKFGTLTLPPEIDAGKPSLSTVEADAVAWRRLRHLLKRADGAELGAHVLLWKREVGGRGEHRLHRHLVLVTHLPHRVLCRLARRAGYGLSKFKLVDSGAMAARYVGKYVAKPDAGLAAWPSRTRWAQSWIKPARRQTKHGHWLVDRFPRFATERAVRECFELMLARREREQQRGCGFSPHGEVWSPEPDGAWAPRPPPRE
jgi:hypothetical protein